MALVVGLIGLLSYQNYWRARQLAIRAKQLELESLQARIRPHFLFNTLNTGAALIHAQPDAAEQVLLDLADLFRSALRSPQHVPLSEELKLTQRYLQIESLRLGDRLRLNWEVPEQLPEILAPSLSIQPLAENAIRHGIEQLVGGGQIDIHVRVLDNAVEVCIANDMADDCSNSRGHSVGLASSRERVHAMTAGRGHIQGQVTDGRYIARLYLPLEPPSPDQVTTR
ncbi:histidine kinase [Stenotrophomonas koreensis]|uniref:sensor histidine kinase n=1 Tax=Stenotrophomonas koreensis TaxID=266128 RepID=UPI0033993C2B